MPLRLAPIPIGTGRAAAHIRWLPDYGPPEPAPPSLRTVAIVGFVSTIRIRGPAVRDYVRERFSYRYVEAPDGDIARAVEAEVGRGALGGVRPALNPLWQSWRA